MCTYAQQGYAFGYVGLCTYVRICIFFVDGCTMGEDGKVGESFLEMTMKLHFIALLFFFLFSSDHADTQVINIILESSIVSIRINLTI